MERTREQQRSEIRRWSGYWRAKGFTVQNEYERPVLVRPDCRIEYRHGQWLAASVDGITTRRATIKSEMLIGVLKSVH